MSKTQYSCVRINKIRTAADARNATRHGRRVRGAFNKSAVDLERTHLNVHWRFDPDVYELEEVDECPDYREELEKRREQLKAKRPKNGVFGTEMMFIASRAVFKEHDPKDWAKACLEIAEKRYPGLCVAARLDMDETTPHLSVFIMPVYEKGYSGEKRKSKREPRKAVSHNKVFGGPADLSLLQDWAADGLKEKGFGVERGVPVGITRATNQRPNGVLYQKLVAMWNKLKAREKKIEQVEGQLEERRKTFAILADIFRKESKNLTTDGKIAINSVFGLKPLRQKEEKEQPPAPKI